MHMADALISPVVGGTMWIASSGIAAYSTKKLNIEMDEKKIPLMGVMGAFVFAAQMINFTIPGTGSSGHIGGGLLLAILLGPYAGFLTMAAVLAIQAFFFADGGLLALGCNIFNMGFYTCFIAYPFIYKLIIKKGYSATRLFLASVIATIIGLQLGSLSVVLQTLFSGVSELPFQSFLMLMQPIHLGIGFIEGLVIAAVVSFVYHSRPEILKCSEQNQPLGKAPIKAIVTVFIVLSILVGGAFSWFASENPDGLEWSMFHTSGKEELEADSKVHQNLESVQSATSILPDYGFKDAEDSSEAPSVINVGTSVSGIVGGTATMALAILIGIAIKMKKKRRTISS